MFKWFLGLFSKAKEDAAAFEIKVRDSGDFIVDEVGHYTVGVYKTFEAAETAIHNLTQPKAVYNYLGVRIDKAVAAVEAEAAKVETAVKAFV